MLERLIEAIYLSPPSLELLRRPLPDILVEPDRRVITLEPFIQNLKILAMHWHGGLDCCSGRICFGLLQCLYAESLATWSLELGASSFESAPKGFQAEFEDEGG
jgi:hypothetical protein